MPPQVRNTGEVSAPIPQAPVQIEEPKTKEIDTKDQKPEPPKQDAKIAAKNAEGAKQNAIDKKEQDKVQAQMTQKNLQKQVPAKAGTAYTASDLAADVAKSGIKSTGNSSANQPSAEASGLKKGESISAKVTDNKDGIHFEFERPITKDQAGAIIFQDGKVPQNSTLEGSGKNWAVKTPSNAEDRAKTLTHFNKRTETIKIPDRRPNDVMFADREITNTWTGGDLKTTGPRPAAAERRSDLKNDMGFTINNNYLLDQGKTRIDSLGLQGMGYEVGFEKPMTKDQVMNKLFDKEKVNEGQIRLIPKSKEPATQWNVEVVGMDGLGSFKTEPGRGYSDVGRAFQDANVYGKQSLHPDTPASVRKHIENRTLPEGAANPKKGVYVWEKDGHMVYVKTNNTGKIGDYDAQVTQMPTEKQSQKWMRENMIEKGMEPREAWQTFWKDTVEVEGRKLGMINSAWSAPQILRPAKITSSFGDEHVSTSRAPRANIHANESQPSKISATPREHWQDVNVANKQLHKTEAVAHTGEKQATKAETSGASRSKTDSKEANVSKTNHMSREADIKKELGEIERDLEDQLSAARDIISQGGTKIPGARQLRDPNSLKARLRDVIRTGEDADKKHAQDVLDAINDLEARRGKLHREQQGFPDWSDF